MGFGQKVTKTARTVQAVGRFCTHPFCLHVAGTAKCKRACCQIKKGKK